MPGPNREIDPIKDRVGDVGPVYAAAFYQGMTVVLEAEGSFMRIRWSPLHRLEPENFPETFEYRTSITVGDAVSCRFIEAADYLYLFGGDRVYRLQRAGRSLGVTEVAQGYPLLHRNSVVRVGQTIYAATELGLMQLDGRRGSGRIPSTFHKIFFDRWRANLVPSSLSNAVLAGYDSKMECVYFHHRALNETLCLWLTTGTVSLLQFHYIDNLVDGPDLDTEVSRRCYFLSKRRWFNSPNWNVASTDPQTMSGLLLDLQQTTVLYNHEVDSVVGTTTVDGATVTQLALDDTGDSGNSDPFVGDQDHACFPLEGARDFSPMGVAFLTGTLAGKVYQVIRNSEDEIWVEGDISSSVSAGDVVALSPIVTLAVGAPLWVGNGIHDLQHRKTTKQAGVALGRASSNGQASHQQATPVLSTMGHLTFGVSRNDDIVANEPLTTSVTDPIQVHASADRGDGAALDTDRHHKNWVSLRADGTILFPWVRCLTSNLMFEVYEMFFEGDVSRSRISGPGT